MIDQTCLDRGHLLACPLTDLPRDPPPVHRKVLDYLSDGATSGETQTQTQPENTREDSFFCPSSGEFEGFL